MKVLIALSLLTCVALAATELNEDQLRDELIYASNRRSKRALCGEQVRATVPPRVWPTYRPNECMYCSCHNFLTSKRAAVDSSKLGIGGIFPNRCYGSTYTRCCSGIRYPFGSLAKTASAGSVGMAPSSISDASVNSMASSLLNKFGKRASTDNKFKKPSVDLIFLIDDSGSIAPAQFNVALEGAATLSQSLCPQTFGSGKGEKQVSVVLFSTTAQTFLTYEESQRGAGHVEEAILNMKQRMGATSTTDALKHVREKVLTQPGSRLNDPDTATIVFVITDGKCNDGCHELKAEAKKLREAGPGVQVFAFGVGEADCQELEDIRGKEAGEVFGLPDYNFFEKLANSVKEQMAKNSDICVNQ